MVLVLQHAIVKPVVTIRDAVVIFVPRLLAVVVMGIEGVGNAVVVTIAPRLLATVVVARVVGVRDTITITIAPRTPTEAHSPTTSGTVVAGVTITARSTGSGICATPGYALIPSTFDRFGLTGNTVPPNGLPIRFQRSVRPTLPAFSLAPITATDFGSNRASSGRPRPCHTSCASPIG